MARWVAKIGRPVRRADALRAAGVQPEGGSGRAVLDSAQKNGWVKRGARGAVLPGDPPAQ